MKRKMNKRGERESAAGIAAAAGLSPLTEDRTDSPDLTETAAALPAAAEANGGAAVTGGASNALQRCAALRCAVQLRRNPSPLLCSSTFELPLERATDAAASQALVPSFEPPQIAARPRRAAAAQAASDSAEADEAVQIQRHLRSRSGGRCAQAHAVA
jgi:hypothetical protein